MKKLSSVLLLAAVILLTSTIADAQRFTKRKQYWSVGGSINAMNYLGDVVPRDNPASFEIVYTRPNIGIEATKRMTPRVSVRGQFFWGRLKGDDEGNPRPGHDNRNQRFVNDIKELSVVGIYDFFENRGTFLKRPDYTPYVFAGLAAFVHNPRVGNDKTSFNSFDNVGIVQAALVYGIGFRYKLARQWDLALEIGWRNTTSDKLDGVYGQEYKLPSEFGGTDGASYASQPEAYKLHDARKDKTMDPNELRADKKRDAYTVTGLHLTYILSGGVKCPKFR